MRNKKRNWKEKIKSTPKYKDVRGKNSRPLGENHNSPSWYMLNDQLGHLATAINLFTPNGADTKFADGTNLIASNVTLNREPGVAANDIMLIPGGKSDKPTSTVNEAARAMFTYIRNKIMKNITQYQKTDLFNMLYAVANIFGFVAHVETAMRVVKKFNVLNKYTPRDIVTMMGFDYNDMLSNQVQLEFYMKHLTERIKNLVVPKVPLFEEVVETFKYVYVDEDIAKAQFIVNAPYYFWKFQINGTSSKGELVPKLFIGTNTLFTYNAIIQYAEDLLSNIMNDEDYAYISGDILAAYGDSVIKYGDFDTSDIQFTYSKEFLEKWHNSAQFPEAPGNSGVSNWIIEQQTSAQYDDYLVFDPIMTAANATQFVAYKRNCGNRIIDFYDANVTSDQIMVGTRWLYSWEIYDSTTMKCKIRTAGSQVMYRIRLGYRDKDDNFQVLNYYGYHGYVHSTSGFTTTDNDVIVDVLLRKWNYAPITILMMLSSSITSDVLGFIGLVGDLGNYTTVTPQVLENMNVLANYTVLGVTPLLEGK